MKARWLPVVVVVLSLMVTEMAMSQFYVGPSVGFRSYSLKGVFKRTQQATQTGNVADGGKTAFNFGLSAGYGTL